MAFFGFMEDVEQKIVDKWMELTTSTKPLAILQWGIMTTVNATASVLNLFQQDSNLSIPFSPVGQEVMNQIQQVMILPNFMGIPLYSATEVIDRQVDVSEQPTIVQSGKIQQMVSDNAVPRLKTWQYDAYLKSTPGLHILDNSFLVKPTLVLQESLLDSMAKSRSPGWLKTSNGVFELVMITSLHIEHTANVMNAVHINIAFKEYKPIQIKQGIPQITMLIGE